MILSTSFRLISRIWVIPSRVRSRLSGGAEWIRTFSPVLDRRRFRGFVPVGTDLPAYRSSEQLPAAAYRSSCRAAARGAAAHRSGQAASHHGSAVGGARKRPGRGHGAKDSRPARVTGARSRRTPIPVIAWHWRIRFDGEAALDWHGWQGVRIFTSTMVKILDRQGLDAESRDRLDRPDSTRTPMRSSPTRRNGLVP